MEKANADGGQELRGKILKSQQQVATRDAEIKRLQDKVYALQENQRGNFYLTDRYRRTDHLIITAPSPLFIVDSPPNSPSPTPRTRGSANYQGNLH
jgi:hypothetical protein